MNALMPHQWAAADALAGKRYAYLADEPGLGKTRSALAAAILSIPKEIHVVCPAIMKPQWHREAEAVGWTGPLHVHSYAGIVGPTANAIARRAQLSAPESVLLVDEAHELGNPQAQRTKAILSRSAGGLAHTPGRVMTLFLSGTPMGRNPAKLWPIVSSCFPAIAAEVGARTLDEWMRQTCLYTMHRFGVLGRPTAKVHGVRDPARLHALLSRMWIRRVESDIGLSLPPLWWQWVRLGVDDAGLAAADAALDPDVRAAILAGVASAQNEGVVQYRQALGVAKAHALAPSFAAMLDDPTTPPFVILAHHRAALAVLRTALRAGKSGDMAAGFGYIDGSTTTQDRQAVIDGFQSGRLRVVLGAIGAMRTGVTLTAANRIHIVEPGWTADENVQAVKRIHRISQTAPCRAHLYVASGSLDEAVMRQVEKEIAMHELVVDGGTRPLRDTPQEFA